ncbi:hypothetical protein KP509_23G015400 [Ceratopteris richardii]|uniref:Uncharacterized protein n=1 Tax=Ceratopteris richardii TaxID=49495 RepID=A0A8T2RXW3_CERRI|nr:hypothetical protein KP509_23G015400 [Ceratopteris richardii]KAH7301181.1 hypothetical protein KP509_23G015400 [Ceratopteris richardii]KAH7301182.1 hypothetical protein KP509_23G015400 [Ceratopteris richardii]KAH7301183.1 hypothetical protein KP509_23G015400 [Ceratopteris richardii]KAH7301184.1 hypothetical protein KP509_23G015400 [Ceratopteris richardii]
MNSSLELPCGEPSRSFCTEEQIQAANKKSMAPSYRCVLSESRYCVPLARKYSTINMYHARDHATLATPEIEEQKRRDYLLSPSPEIEEQGQQDYLRSSSELPRATFHEEFSDSEESTSPKTSPSQLWNSSSPLTQREKNLCEVWEQKRKLMWEEELVNVKERADLHRLGRSVSDCSKSFNQLTYWKRMQLQRSASDNFENRRKGFCNKHTCSLTDHDFEELQGFIDLGFRFDKSSVPELGNTLPALHMYCASFYNIQDSVNLSSPTSPAEEPLLSDKQSPLPLSPNLSHGIASPDDDPEVIKGRLKHWAQAVACEASLCSD